MTDHLEPYRRMARSIRFIPPLSLNQPSQASVSQPQTPAPVGQSSWQTTSWTQAKPAEGPPIDLSEHTAALVQEAVSKPTVLPGTYSIQENIGDRISRLVPAKSVKPTDIQFKIPQPDPNWTAANGTPAESGIDPSEHVAALVQEAVSQPTLLPERYTIPENIGDRISRLGTAQPEAPVVEAIPEPEISETQTPQQSEEPQTSAAVAPEAPAVEETPEPQISETQTQQQSEEPQASAAVAPEAPVVEETPEPEISETELKKSLDDTHLEVSDSAVSEVPAVEEVSSGDAVAGVVESSEVEEKASDEAASAPVAESTVEETANVEATSAVEESVEHAHKPNLVERVSSAVEAAVTAFQHPHSDREDSEANQEPVTLEASATEKVESSATQDSVEQAQETHPPTLVERVSAAVEAATTAFQHPEPEEKSSEAQPELARSEVTLETTPAEPEKATDAETKEKPQQAASSPVEASKAKAPEVSTVSSTKTSGSSKPRGKKKTKAKGFGGSKDK
ncbi:MAG TPA: hypothetical protein V6C85_19335 [Allocoleopsis sp.]